MYARKWARILDFIGPVRDGSSVIEVGCGGAPERHIISTYPRYTGVDFSEQGLAVARERSRADWPRASFTTADAVALPFGAASFDCVYSAHMIYHIADPAAQAQALEEMLRVLRPGGSLVVLSANPRPLLFPMRMLNRLIAETPGLRRVGRLLKGPSPIPYNPQRIGWTLSRLSRAGSVTVITGGMASTSFNQNVTEYRGLGKLLWRTLSLIDACAPRAAAHLGNYVVFLVRKSP